MAEKKQITTREKRLKKISQLEARLQKQRALLGEEKRKERNGQLIAFGIWVEEYLKQFPGRKASVERSMNSLLSGRNLEKALAGIERIFKEKIKLT
ncbi:hypothetical protein [Sangeribacter muris]|uniref:hypothetical protein n=1 Tax=Sangeribacter muris TaxID=2880703 RepID=UPI00244DE3C3|nr:hypothetical protein [Sangeribacter muris]